VVTLGRRRARVTRHPPGATGACPPEPHPRGARNGGAAGRIPATLPVGRRGLAPLSPIRAERGTEVRRAAYRTATRSRLRRERSDRLPARRSRRGRAAKRETGGKAEAGRRATPEPRPPPESATARFTEAASAASRNQLREAARRWVVRRSGKRPIIPPDLTALFQWKRCPAV
jgi:hypothetical protein